jgi:hypothetical protein
MRILVAIANYGTGNRKYLDRLIEEYRSMPWDVDIVVLSNIPKDLPGGVEVLVGLPDPSNPWSLPFAHRELFAQRRGQYDLFIYSEDDTLVRAENIEAFMHASRVLQPGEIGGFLRSETDAQGRVYVSSIHAFFRWVPSEVVERGDRTFAVFSNEHSACYMITRDQLETAIASGGFIVRPHNGRYDMLCAAATDVYTQCGLKRLICISDLRDFLLPHLPNKYIGKMGIPLDIVEAQTAALQRLASADGWRGPLVNVETGLPFGTWSKDLYERPDTQLLELIPPGTRRLLSVGCGWGATEALLAARGMDVTALPIDPVFGDALRRGGVRTVEGPLDQALSRLTPGFDCILLPDILHLVADPGHWLAQLRPLLNTTSGAMVLSVPNTRDLMTLRATVGKVSAALGPLAEHWRVTPTSGRRIKKWFKAAGLVPDSIVPVLTGRRRVASAASLGVLNPVLAQRLLGRAAVRA